jgi:myo-inositol catabolism protein IolS
VEYRPLGGEREVSVVGFGCWAIGGHGYGAVDDVASRAAVRRAWDLGVTLFDTADIYGFGHSETVLSNALGQDRNTAIIATKFGVAWDESGKTWRDATPRHARKALDASLKRLRLERIPLYQVHWPDASTSLDDTLGELERQREAGKIEMIGVSNFGASEIISAGAARVVSAQYAFNLVNRTHVGDVIACSEAGVGVLAYGVLARGLLSGKFDGVQEFAAGDTRAKDPIFRGEALNQMLSAAKLLRETAVRAHATPAQIAIRWATHQPGITSVIIGAKTSAQVEENVFALRTSILEEDEQRLGRLTFPTVA